MGGFHKGIIVRRHPASVCFYVRSSTSSTPWVCIRHLCAAVNAHKGDFAASRLLLSHFLGMLATRPEKRRRLERGGLLYRREGNIGVTRKKREEREGNTSSDEWPAVNSQYNLAAGNSDLGRKHPVSGRWRWSSRRLSRGFFRWRLLCFDWRPSTLWLSGSARKNSKEDFWLVLDLCSHCSGLKLCHDCCPSADSWLSAWLITAFELSS